MEKVKLQNRRVIVCPHCGCEYLPGEIFYPDNVVGQPSEVLRDSLGKIIYNEYPPDKQPEAEEHFTCEVCGKPFVVEVDVRYKVKQEVAERDFTAPVTLF